MLIKDCDLAGFNSDRFDIPLLAEELLSCRSWFWYENSVSVDVQTIFIKRTNIRAALKFYCGQSLENAHSAEAYTTYEILKAQLERLSRFYDIKSLSEFTRKKIDFAGMIAFDKEDGYFLLENTKE
jgi:DNA polymerase-3 subunit epsilon